MVSKRGEYFALWVFCEIELYTFSGGRGTSMIIPASQGLAPEEHRLQAVLALFRGEKS
jgi:hypothetical protein